jgi:hypothetical protein
MKTIPLTPDIEKIARRIVWFETPEKALADSIRFLADLATTTAQAHAEIGMRFYRAPSNRSI